MGSKHVGKFDRSMNAVLTHEHERLMPDAPVPADYLGDHHDHVTARSTSTPQFVLQPSLVLHMALRSSSEH